MRGVALTTPPETSDLPHMVIVADFELVESGVRSIFRSECGSCPMPLLPRRAVCHWEPAENVDSRFRGEGKDHHSQVALSRLPSNSPRTPGPAGSLSTS